MNPECDSTPLGGRTLRRTLRSWGLEVPGSEAKGLLHDAQKTDHAGRRLDMPKLVEELANVQGRYLYRDPTPPNGNEPPMKVADVPERIQRAFRSLDQDCSGYVDLDEMCAGLFRYGMDVRSPAPMARARTAAGVDGKLDMLEFHKLVNELELEKSMEREMIEHAKHKVTPVSARAMNAAFANQRAQMHLAEGRKLGIKTH